MDRPPVVIDNGTGYTKMGFAKNVDPQHVIPTCVAENASSTSTNATRKGARAMRDLDFVIGDEAVGLSASRDVRWPIRHGTVENWEAMEKFWEASICQYLRCDPEDHYFLLTEPPLNPPENREYTAEIMFESFNAPGMYIGVQAVMALAASIASKKQSQYASALTGTVIDIGDGVTHVIPVSDGYVLGSSIKSVPLAGRDLTTFVQCLMRERGERVPPEDAMEVARKVKEEHCYVCKDIVKEFLLHERMPGEHVVKINGVRGKTGDAWTADVGYERFLAPEVFFQPEIYTSDYLTPLPELVHQAIASSPIDTRRNLYGNIVLSGGSTMFKGFGKRIRRDVKRLVDTRIAATTKGAKLTSKEVDVEVVTHSFQRTAVWFGGSVLASTPGFYSSCVTKADYEEHGASVVRQNPVFRGV